MPLSLKSFGAGAAFVALAGLVACEASDDDATVEPVADPDVVADLPVEDSIVQPLTLMPTDPLTWILETPACEGEVSIDGQILIFDRDFADKLFEDAKSETEAFCGFAAEEAGATGMWDLDIDWTATAAPQGLDQVSLKGGHYEFAGGAHGNFGTYSLIWDRTTDTEVDPARMFVSYEAMIEALLGPVRDTIGAQKSERYGYEFEAEEIAELLPDTLTWFTRVTLLPSTDPTAFGGLTVHFDPYDIGVYAEGGYTAHIPQALFRDALAPEWAGRFAGAPPASAIVSDP
ncbi:MAG: hypothetical protein AAF216_03245 [Pseudomonadota bacterium]